MNFKKTRLWRDAFESRDNDSYQDIRTWLASALDSFRANAAILAEEIPRDVAQLTDHSVRHLDALWDIADLIAGPDLKLNPAEAFVFGGAVLLHDLANAVVAYPRGLEELQDRRWDDLVHAAYLQAYDRRPTVQECRRPSPELYPGILLQRLRQAHAEQAENLATIGFYRPGRTAERIHLIEDQHLREDLGRRIGRIAHSHHWDIERVVSSFKILRGTPPSLPAEWIIDDLKVASLLRVSDIAHLDSRRAPALVHALRRPSGESAKHWDFQSHLERPNTQNEQLVFTTKTPFSAAHRDAWWLCYETLGAVDRELRDADAVLRIERSCRFAARSVARIEAPEKLAALIETEGWTPVDVRVRITDVANVIERFGGKQLYGSDPRVPLRELIANAADAVRARRALTQAPEYGRIIVRVGEDAAGWWLEVEDNGIGMSEAVLKGPLLDFGTSYWRSGLARAEHPGLLSSDFNPTGRFGIGFFSVFMLGRRVRVVSRRYDLGSEQTRVLDVTMGDYSKPYMRTAHPAEPAERLVDGGTRVRVWLEQRQQSPRMPNGAPMGASAQAKSFVSQVGSVAPALDVSIYVLEEGQDGAAPRLVVTANDWEHMKFEELENRISGVHRSYASKAIGELAEIRRDGHLIGRFRLAQVQGIPCGTFVVRGLSTLKQHNGFTGVLVAENPNLSRNEATPMANMDEWRGAVRSVYPSLVRHQGDWEESVMLSQYLAGLDVCPEGIACFVVDGKQSSLDEVRKKVRGIRRGGRLLVVASEWIPDEDEPEASLYPLLGALKPFSSVVLAPEDESRRFGLSLHDLLPREEFVRILNDRAESIGDSIGLIGNLVVEIAAEAWGVEPSKLYAESSSSLLPIGKLHGETVEAKCVVLTRPKR